MNLKKIQNLPNTKTGKILNLIRFFGGHSPLFLSVCLAITYRCNSDCEFCYQPREKRKVFPDMNIQDVAMIEGNIRKLFNFIRRIHLFGGEPTVNKYFLEILHYFSEKKYKISLTTNGIDIDRFVQEFAAIHALSEINISLNTMDFGKLLSTLRLFKKYEQKKPVYINLACPINLKNQASLIDIIKTFENTYAKCITFQHTTFSDNYEVVMDFNIIRRQIEEIRKSNYKIMVLFLPDIKPEDIKNYYTNLSYPYSRNKCIAPWIAPFVEPNGNVVPCDGVDIIMGNAKEEKMEKIWNNDKYKDFREKIQKYGISHPICRRCCHRQYY